MNSGKQEFRPKKLHFFKKSKNFKNVFDCQKKTILLGSAASLYSLKKLRKKKKFNKKSSSMDMLQNVPQICNVNIYVYKY